MTFQTALDRFYLLYSQSVPLAHIYALAHLCYALANQQEAEWLYSVLRYFEMETAWLEASLVLGEEKL